MIVTASMLCSLGAVRVVVLPQPVMIINGSVARTKTLEYHDPEEIRLAKWFQDAINGALLIICEGDDNRDEYYVRLFDCPRCWSPVRYGFLGLADAKCVSPKCEAIQRRRDGID